MEVTAWTSLYHAMHAQSERRPFSLATLRRIAAFVAPHKRKIAAFLGLSVEAPNITWGSIIGEGRIKFNETPHMVFLPGAVLFLTVLSLNFVGDQLLKRFDIKEAGL